MTQSSGPGAGDPDAQQPAPTPAPSAPTGPPDPTRPMPQQAPSQGYPPQPYPPQGYPSQGYPPQPYPPQGYPPQGPGAPTGPTGAQGVQFGPPPQSTGRRSGGPVRVLLVAALVAVVVLVGGAGLFAYQKLAARGGQPDTVVPADAVAYLRLDVDPSAGQKIAAVRFLNKVPKLKEAQSKDGDLREQLWNLIASSNPKLKSVSYQTDVKPWVGDRVALALLPGGTKDKPNTVLALQVTDEGKARDGIARITSASGKNETDLNLRNGYALFSPKGTGASLLGALDKGSLAGNATYASDMKVLGEQGIASVWFDGKGLANLASTMTGTGGKATAGPDLQGLGHGAVAVRFEADYVELAGVLQGVKNLPKLDAGTSGMAKLPDNTVAAVQLSGLGDALGRAWPDIQKAIGSTRAGADTLSGAEQELGVKLPDDLQVLLGKSLTLALPEQDLRNLGGKAPTVGLKAVTTDGRRADQLVKTLVQKSGADSVVKQRVDGDTLYVATSEDYLASLQTGGNLGGSGAFKLAVADGDKANAGIFVDLDKLEPYYLDRVPKDSREFVQAMRSVGLSLAVTGEGNATFALRVVGN